MRWFRRTDSLSSRLLPAGALAVGCLWIVSYAGYVSWFCGLCDIWVGQGYMRFGFSPSIPTGLSGERFGPTRGYLWPRLSRSHVIIPLWIVCAGLAFAVWKQYRRRRDELPEAPSCETCGYLLTGNITGVCPECGTRTPRMT